MVSTFSTCRSLTAKVDKIERMYLVTEKKLQAVSTFNWKGQKSKAAQVFLKDVLFLQ